MLSNTSKAVSKAIWDKNLEIRYNEKYIKDEYGRLIHLNMAGKIRCPLLNRNISTIVCSKIMDKPDWPRGIDKNICSKCNCYIHVSISKYAKRRYERKTNSNKGNTPAIME